MALSTSPRLRKRLPNAKLLGETSLMFEIHPTLTSKDIDNNIAIIDKVMNIASQIKIVHDRKTKKF